ncbi:MAG: hypothetical protein KF685_07935 [Acidobacteria bacterium]|nr:hypothetical protein [Acidobacteriota bacterium]
MHIDLTFMKTVKYSAMILSVLMLAGIVTVMFLARGTGEDITGVVSPALLVAILSGATALIATVLQRRI